jgi:hypothetical protein
MLLKVISGTASSLYAPVTNKKAPTSNTGKGCWVHRPLVSIEPAESVPIIIPETRIIIK